jgi:AraC-like DNA-binding protein
MAAGGAQMPENATYAFTEPDDYESSIVEATVDLLVIGRGRFKSTLTRVRFNELLLLRTREDLESVAHMALVEDLVFVTFPARFNPTPIWGGHELRQSEMVVHSRGERLHHRAAGPSEKCFIALRPERLAFWSAALIEEEIVAPPFARIVRPSELSTSRLLHLHSSACGMAETSPELLAHPEVARSIEQELIHMLITCISVEGPSPNYLCSSGDRLLMNRFEEAVAAHRGQPLHIPGLCAAVGASERVLRARCAEFLGMSPSRYLRLRRLRLARSELTNVDSAVSSVAETAKRYGFDELGRFAGMYRSVYGETPSTTLRRRIHRSHGHKSSRLQDSA